MAGGICSGASEQLSADGSVAFGELELPAAALPRTSESGFAHEGVWAFGAAVSGSIADWLVVVGRICGGRCVAANTLGECAAVLFPLFVLSVAVQSGILIAILSAAVSGTRNLGSASRLTNFQTEAGYGIGFGVGSNRADLNCFGK